MTECNIGKEQETKAAEKEIEPWIELLLAAMMMDGVIRRYSSMMQRFKARLPPVGIPKEDAAAAVDKIVRLEDKPDIKEIADGLEAVLFSFRKVLNDLK